MSFPNFSLCRENLWIQNPGHVCYPQNFAQGKNIICTHPACARAQLLQSCPILSNPMLAYSPGINISFLKKRNTELWIVKKKKKEKELDYETLINYNMICLSVVANPYKFWETLSQGCLKYQPQMSNSKATGKDIALFSWSAMKISLRYDELAHYGREGKMSLGAALSIHPKVGH